MSSVCLSVLTPKFSAGPWARCSDLVSSLCFQWETAYFKLSWSLNPREAAEAQLLPLFLVTGGVLPGIVAQMMSRWGWPPDVLVLMSLNHPSEQAALDSEPALADGAGKALLSYHVCTHWSAQLHSNNLHVAINKIPAGLLSHMDMALKQGFFPSLCCQPHALVSQSLLTVKRFQKSFHLQLLTE